MAAHKPSQGYVSQAPVTYESVIPNPNLKLLDLMREVMRLWGLNIEHRTGVNAVGVLPPGMDRPRSGGAGQLLRSGTSALPNHGEAQAAEFIAMPGAKTPQG
jgi:hypothetical protein